MVADANEPSSTSSTRPCTRSCTNSRRDTGTSQSKKAAMKHTLCARPAYVSACKPARSADWHSQACGTSHWSLSRASSLLMPRHAPPPREHMHHPHIASFLDTACTTLARSSTACSSQNGSLIHRSSKRKGQGARCEQRPCPTAHNKSWWQQRCIICLATCTTCPQQHRMQQPKRLAHPPQQQPQRPRRSMRAQAVPDSSYVSWWQQRSNHFLFPTPAKHNTQ